MLFQCPVCWYLDGLVRPGDKGDEERQHHVDEEGDEGVEVDLAEDPHQRAAALQAGEGHEHVVAVDEREQTLGHTGQSPELRSQSKTQNFCLWRGQSSATPSDSGVL